MQLDTLTPQQQQLVELAARLLEDQVPGCEADATIADR
jgi:hypothetical protein